MKLTNEQRKAIDDAVRVLEENWEHETADRLQEAFSAISVPADAGAPTLLGSPAEGHWGEPETPSDGHKLESDVDEEAQRDERAACMCSGLGPCERPGDVSCRIARATAPQATCQTCSGHGMIGGPSYREPNEGGAPCPDCAAVAQAGATLTDEQREALGWVIDLLKFQPQPIDFLKTLAATRLKAFRELLAAHSSTGEGETK